MSRLLDNVCSELQRLPGIGRRTAMRLAMHILKMDTEVVDSMADSIVRFRHDIRHCVSCNNLSDDALCPICSDTRRDRSTICVVEQVGDLLSIENTGQYHGQYHVLGGVISPMQGIGPSDLKIDLLCDKLLTGEVREVIIAISTSVEGETTLFYLLNRLKAFPDVKVILISPELICLTNGFLASVMFNENGIRFPCWSLILMLETI